MKAQEFTLRDRETNQLVNEFLQFAVKKLNLELPLPKITFSKDTDDAQCGHHTGSYTWKDGQIWVYAKNRNLVDIFRTLVHELVHVKQHQQGRVQNAKGGPGSEIEQEADAVAGYLMKLFGEKHPEIFQ